MNLLNRLKKELKAWKSSFIVLNNRSPGVKDIKSESEMEKKYYQYKMLKKRKETFKFIQTCKTKDMIEADIASVGEEENGSNFSGANPENLGLEILVDESNTIEELNDLMSSNSHDITLSYDSFIEQNALNEIPSIDNVLNGTEDGEDAMVWNDITNARIHGGPTACSNIAQDSTFGNNDLSFSANGLFNNPNSCTLTDTINSYLNEFPASADVTSYETVLDNSLGLTEYDSDPSTADNGAMFKQRNNRPPEKHISADRQRTNKVRLDLRKGYHSKLSSRKGKQSKTAMEFSSCNSDNFEETATSICHSSEFLSNTDAKDLIFAAVQMFDLLNNREYSAMTQNHLPKRGLIVNGHPNPDTAKILTTLLISKVNHSINRVLLKIFSKEDTKKMSLYKTRSLFKMENTSNLEFLELNSFVSFGTQNYIVETCKQNRTYLVLFTTVETLLNFKLFYSNFYETIIRRSLFSIEEEIPFYLQACLFKLNDFIYFGRDFEKVDAQSLTCASISYTTGTSDIEVSTKFIGSEYLKETLNYLQQIRKTYLGPIIISTKNDEEASSLSAYLRTESYSNETFLPMEESRCCMGLNHFSTRGTWVADKTNDQTVIDYHKKAFKKKLVVTTDGEHLKYFRGYSVVIKLGFPEDLRKYENLGIKHLVILFNPVDYFNKINEKQSIYESSIVIKGIMNCAHFPKNTNTSTATNDMFVVENDFRFAQSRYTNEKSLIHVLNHLVEEKVLGLVRLDKIQFSVEVLSNENADDFIARIRDISTFNKPYFKVDLRNLAFSEYENLIKEVETLKAQKTIKLANIRKGMIFRVYDNIDVFQIQKYIEEKICHSMNRLKSTNDVLFEMASAVDKSSAKTLLSDVNSRIESQLKLEHTEPQNEGNVPLLFKRYVSVSLNNILEREKELQPIDIQLIVDQCSKKYPKLSRLVVIKTIDNYYQGQINNKG
eukprot:GAHX01001651.1.p1 GENE.GAHX01001651.1~~GAHX01001651.1.p1  ORF type:complete len:946 (+),score=180.82 GAHX01001651.1:45-2882(+)